MMPTLNDGVMSKLSAFPGTANDKQMAWLATMIAPTVLENPTLVDLWEALMIKEGRTSGSLQEDIRGYMHQQLGPAGTGVTAYNDIQTLFWNS